MKNILFYALPLFCLHVPRLLQRTPRLKSSLRLQQQRLPLMCQQPCLSLGRSLRYLEMNQLFPKGIPAHGTIAILIPALVVFYDGVFHMFRNGFRGFPAASQVGYVTSSDGYTWTKQGDEPVFETKDVAYAKIAMYASSALVEDDGTWVIYFYTWDSSSFPSSSVIGRATATDPNLPVGCGCGTDFFFQVHQVNGMHNKCSRRM